MERLNRFGRDDKSYFVGAIGVGKVRYCCVDAITRNPVRVDQQFETRVDQFTIGGPVGMGAGEAVDVRNVQPITAGLIVNCAGDVDWIAVLHQF